MQTIIYHNPRCRKSREALALLQENTQQLTVVEYLKNAFTEDELSTIIQKLNIQPIELVRKGESIWKEKFKGKDLNNKEILKAMIQNPKLIERPIVVSQKGAVVARPAEKLLELI